MSDNRRNIPGLYSRDAEQSVIGGLMLDNDCWDEVVLRISAGDFFNHVHREIFMAMSHLVAAGRPIDLLTLSESIESRGKDSLEQLGGFAYMAELAKNTPSVANITHYCDIVARYSRGRQLAAIGNEIHASATAPGADNGIELPDVQGAIVSGTATGDWTLSCVRGSITSITFVFADGTVRTLPSPDSQNGGGNNQNSQNSSGNGSNSIGWLSDDNGIPCISGIRKSNASTYLPTISLLAGAAAAGDALSQNQMTGQTNAMGGVTQTLTGDAGQAVLGKSLSGSMKETVDWVKQRYGQTFDAIYVPPGQTVALHIIRQLAIDYEEKGRRVKYDFSLAGSGTGMD